MDILNWINANGLIACIMLFVGIILLLGIDVLSRWIYDKYLWKVRLDRGSGFSEDTEEWIDYVDEFRDTTNYFCDELDGLMSELDRLRGSGSPDIKFGDNVIKLRKGRQLDDDEEEED